MANDGEFAGLRDYPLARRGFISSGLVSGFTLATTRVDAQAIRTDTAGIDAGEAHIPVPDGELPGYFARPPGGGPFPIVLVNEEVFGVHEHIRDICRRLAKLGYVAIAPEIYAREGNIGAVTDMGELQRNFISKAPDERVMSDLDHAVTWAAGNGGDLSRVGVTGFCRGGRNTWLYAAHNPALKAAVAWYGPIMGATSPIQPKTVADMADAIGCPLLGLYGGQDAGIKVADVQAAAAKAREAGKTVEIVVYQDAPHGFNADYRPSYKAADAMDGWRRMLAWFERYGVA